MKSINEYTLTECIERLRELPNGTVDDACDAVMLPGVPWIFDVAEELADRIYDLTRWIPVEERLPTNEDADENGRVLVSSIDLRYDTRYYESWVFEVVSVEGGTQYLPTHWKRIDKPEGV